MKTSYKKSFIFEAYEMAKSGMFEKRIAGVLGVSYDTLVKWKEDHPMFGMALRKGRKIYKGKATGTMSFRDYVFGRLSPELKKVWNEIMAIDKKKKTSGIAKIEAILAKRGVRVRQNLFIYAWTASNFSISEAMRKVCLSRSTFELWKNNDPDFAALIDEINFHKKNFFESSLIRLVKQGDTAATIFANKTYNSDIGYGDKRKVDVNVSGELHHQHNIVSIDDMNLPLKTRKEILDGIRRYNDASAITNN